MSTSHIKKGQVSMEFVAMISFVLLIFTGFYAGISHKQMVAAQYNRDLQAKMLAEYITYQLDLVLTYGGNFTKKVHFPESIDGTQYNITYSERDNCNLIFVNYENKFAFSCTSARVNGSLYSGNNILKNRGGDIIYANQ